MVYPFSTKVSSYEKGAFSNENNEATGHLYAKNHMKEMNLEFYLYTGKKGQKESCVKKNNNKTKPEKLFKKSGTEFSHLRVSKEFCWATHQKHKLQN